MKLINNIPNKVQTFTVILIALALTSCGSYQYVGQTSDGIYGTSTENYEKEAVAIPAENNNDYYSNYFKEKVLEAEAYTQTDDVFTDIDSYQGTYDDDLEDTEQNAGWGATNSNITINLHDTGYYNNYGWNRPWGWNGWYNWGWNTPYSWNYGYGWNNNFYNPYWGWGWNSPYYGFFNQGFGYGYAFNHGYYRRGISYNSGPRGALLNRNSVLSTRYSRNNTVRPRTNTTVRPRTNTTVRPRTNNTVRPRTNNTVRPRANTPTPRPRVNSTSTPRTNTSSPRSSSSPRSRPSSSGGSKRGRG